MFRKKKYIEIDNLSLNGCKYTVILNDVHFTIDIRNTTCKEAELIWIIHAHFKKMDKFFAIAYSTKTYKFLYEARKDAYDYINSLDYDTFKKFKE